MTPATTDSTPSAMMAPLTSWVHSVTPADSPSFEMLAWFSLVCYLVFAWVALHYALKAWAGKVMFVSMALGTLASLWLHLCLLHAPSYLGTGSLWRFISLSQYLPWAVISLGGMYLLYRVYSALMKRRE